MMISSLSIMGGTMDAREFLQLREELEERRGNLARLQGKMEVSLQRLEKEFGCKSVLEGKKLQSSLDKQLKVLESDLKEKTEEFEKDFGELLGQ